MQWLNKDYFNLNCDYCKEDYDPEDLHLTTGKKQECYRCRYYYQNKYGLYQIKNRFFTNKLPDGTLIHQFVDDGTGHWILNPDFHTTRGQWKKKK